MFSPVLNPNAPLEPTVYQLSAYLVAKFDVIGRRDDYHVNHASARLEREATINGMLSQKFPISKSPIIPSYGVEHLVLPESTWFAHKGERLPVHIMRYLPGVRPLNQCRHLPLKVLAQLQQEYDSHLRMIAADKRLGLIPDDKGPENCLYDELNSKIYLIDFIDWEIKSR